MNTQATSLEAYEMIQPVAGTIRAEIYDLIKAAGDHGMTRYEIECEGYIGHTVSPRVLELIKDGLVVQTTERRPTRHGRTAFVVKAV